MTTDNCGYKDTHNGEPCQNPAGTNGWCWIPSHNPEPNDNDSPGRPTKLTARRQETIAQAIEQGHTFRSACETSGIDKSTGHRWMKLGEDQQEGIYSDFHNRITRARGKGKTEIERSIVEICREKNDARTLLNYLKHIEGGHAAAEDDELAGLNLVVPEVAEQDE